jgi:uncharacterized membrane-anchored protein YhcB (DUF1043 family)
MEISWLISLLTGVVTAMVGFYAKNLREDLTKTQEQLVNVQINYVHKEELRTFRNEVIDLLKEVRQDIKEIKDK